MKNTYKILATTMVFMMAISSPQASHACDVNATERNALVVKRMGDDFIKGKADPRFGSVINADPLKIIFQEACDKGADPRSLAAVNRKWHHVMREGQYSDAKLDRATMNPFMQGCMDLYYYSVLKRGSLVYTDPNTKEVQTFPISAFKNPLDGVFDLSTCGDTHKYLRIVMSIDEFFKIRKENQERVVILVATRNTVNKDKRFSAILEKWDPKVAPVGLFWRWGNKKNLSCYDYLITASGRDLSSSDLCENWKKRGCACRRPDYCWIKNLKSRYELYNRFIFKLA